MSGQQDSKILIPYSSFHSKIIQDLLRCQNIDPIFQNIQDLLRLKNIDPIFKTQFQSYPRFTKIPKYWSPIQDSIPNLSKIY